MRKTKKINKLYSKRKEYSNAYDISFAYKTIHLLYRVIKKLQEKIRKQQAELEFYKFMNDYWRSKPL